MAHKSRLGCVIIDCRTEDLEGAAGFWSEALGYAIRRSDNPDDANYVGLDADRDDLGIEVQMVDHESRVHLDIETDDIEAEAKRLEALGAKRVQDLAGDGGANRSASCLVGPQNADFAAKAKTWN